MKFPVTVIAALGGLSIVGGVVAADDSREALRFFETEIRPLLAAECYDCHGAEKSKGGLRLDHRELILKGGETGAALVPGKPEESLLVEAIHRVDEDFSMPPKKALEAGQVAALEKWISMGAPWPEESVTKSEVDENGFTEEDREWWAIQPVKDSPPPAAGEGWAKNAVDRFVAAKLKDNKLQPAPVASADELVRRIYFDLHGLPPTAEQVNAFEKAFAVDADKAVASLTDELLASPRYGERWGQHWLDVVRYADSDGYRADSFRPETWMYRDYVIRSINEDKPYNQFIREQLAADEFAPDDPDTVIATAFLRLGVYEWNQRNAEMQWELILTEMTNVTGEAFLGLGVGCAQCHDHKFDPILQKDYFALQAFLNSTWWPENRPLVTPEQQMAHDAAMAKWEAATKDVREQIDAMTESYLAGKKKAQVKMFPEAVQAMYNKSASERTAYEEQVAQMVQRQVDYDLRRADFKKAIAKDEAKLARYTELTEKLKAFDDIKPKPLPLAFITTDVGARPAQTLLERRGKKEVIAPAFLTLLGESKPEIKATEQTTGRRTALANWIASEDNPLTPRVMVNRIWQRHFGTGLVPTPNDFGRLGEEPSHPQLLDWMTSRFLDEGWRMKPIHRLIVNSATYRQTARYEPGSTESITDPQNRLLWRFPPRRLSAEQVRDAMLATSGELQDRDGGTPVSGNSPNRSVYMKKMRNSPDAMIGGFDAPLGFNSQPNRVPTTTPNQSLMLVNGEWTLSRAQAFARQVLAGKSSIGADEIKKAYRTAFGRDASGDEVADALAFIDAQQSVVDAPPAPPAKFPKENGLRPVEQYFKSVDGIELGSKSLWLQPDSRFERLDVGNAIDLPDEKFTVEAVAIIDAIHKDASVNTLFGQWNGSQDDVGWSFGITSEKSRYQPRNFIMQLVGDDFQSNRIYEVVASDLRFPIGKPVYFAAAVSAAPSKDDPAKGSVTFYLKDLSDPNAVMQTQTIEHSIVGGLKAQPEIKTIIGGRDQKGHLWDGQLARLTVSDGVLSAGEILFKGGSIKRIADWDFSKGTGDQPVTKTAWLGPSVKGPTPLQRTSLFGAVTDFCHALLNSNEFLYLH